VNQFAEECHREWKRLRVPDLVANEMAADLAADLEEAESEGASAAELLGTDASDARSFAASWAAERGVIPPPRLPARLQSRSLVLTALAALTVTASIGSALVLFASPQASAPAYVVFAAPSDQPVTVLAGPERVPLPPPPSSLEASGSGVDIHTIGSILLTVGIVGTILSMLLLLWSSRRRPGLWLASV
jgi:hypothetical protein